MTDKNTPVELVKEAVKETLSSDIFGAVNDRESVYKYSDQKHAKPFGLVKVNGIGIALSMFVLSAG